MKENDTIICKQDFYNNLLRKTSFLKNKPYKIYEINEIIGLIWIIDEDDNNEYFFLVDKSYKNYIEWFYTPEELRTLKLESI